MKNSSRFFANVDCEYYPCHHLANQNCLFCFCPLFNKKDCGGSYVILPNGCKDCSDCVYPHIPGNYQEIINLLK